MARSAIYVVRHRRRREQKTDYALRLSLLKSGVPRLVIRKSNRYVQGQIIKYNPSGDRTLASASSSELRKLGWKHGCSSVTAAYLTGLLLGKRGLGKAEQAVLDAGLQRLTRGNALYAFLKGVTDAGLSVPHDPAVLPSEERLTGRHIKASDDFEAVKKRVG